MEDDIKEIKAYLKEILRIKLFEATGAQVVDSYIENLLKIHKDSHQLR